MNFTSKEEEEQFQRLNKERHDLIDKHFLSGLTELETARLDAITKLFDEQRNKRLAKDLERLDKLAEEVEDVARRITDHIRYVREQIDENTDS